MQCESIDTNNSLFKEKLPFLGHHVYGGRIEHDIKKQFSFVCGCGLTHFAREAYAVREHREEGTAIYACQKNDYLLNMVGHVGFFRVKGIETIASFISDKKDDVYSTIFVFREMIDKEIKTLKEYYQNKSD
jgi:hypothetical protein